MRPDLNAVQPTPPVPVAIIGMACLFPKADDLAGFWAGIRHRTDAITEIPETHWRPDDYFDPDPKAPDRTYVRRGGFINPVDFPPLDFGIAPNNLEATDTTQLLGLLVARQALDDAGYGEGSTKPLDRGRVSVILGVTGTLELVIPLGARLGHPIWRRALQEAGVPEGQAEEVVRRIADSYPAWQENSFPGLLGNVAAGRIANRLDLGGTNCVIDAACASSAGALNLALLELASGRCDLALSGGLDTFNSIFMYMCFSKTPALSPSGDARPFDAGCDGTILGEGLGVVVLKRLDDARRDGDRVYAVVRAVGASSDGKGNAVYAPSAAGQVRALRQAYGLAGFSPATVELVEAHGTGTRVGDATELSALNEVFGEARAGETWCALGSIKSQIGHTKAAAGAAGLIKAALALHHKVLPPTIKVETPMEGVGPGRSPFYLNTEPRPWLPSPDHPRRAAVSAFGFGGSNYHCILEEAEAVKPGIDWDGSVEILAFSARSREGLLSELEAWPREAPWAALQAAAARSREKFRVDDPHRLVLVAEPSTDMPALFESARAAVDERAHGPRRRDGVFHGHGKAPGKLAVVFPGQGSQYVGMIRELSCLFPQVQQALAEAENAGAGSRLVDRVYPLSAFTSEERAANESALRATDVAQPAIGAVSLGLFRVLEHFGVRPDAVAGHSFGELTALCAAGWIDDRSFAGLARERGRLMAAQAARGGGAMLAVLAPLGVVEDVLAAEGLDGPLVIANKNGPRQFVLSGPAAAIEAASRAFEGRGVSTRSLAVSAAFHSPDVAGASEPFLHSLQSVPIQPTPTPIFANTTAGPYPGDADDARALLAGQLARPVEFAAMIEAMADTGITTFVEVGPDARLSGLIRATLDAPGRPAHVLAVDASRGNRGNLADLASALAELAALGYPVLLPLWERDETRDAAARMRPARKPGLTVKVSGANAGARHAAPALTNGPIARSETVETLTAARPAPRAARSATLAPTPIASPMMKPTPPLPPALPATATASNGTAPVASEPPPAYHRNGRQADAQASSGTNGEGHVHGILPPAGGGPYDPEFLAASLRTAQDNLLALQRLSEQTAALHRQFLEGQDRTQRTFQSLLEQQQRLASAALGGQERPAPAPTALRHAVIAPDPAHVPAPERDATLTEQPRAVAGSAHVQEVLLEVVSEKTGYPVDMLEPAMLLDADLGIDSIKRVEIFSALQERLPAAPAVKPEHLGTLRSLQDVIDFLGSGAATAATVAPPPVTADVSAVLLEVVAEKTGYPVDMLEPAMLLDADLGIDSIKRVEIFSALQERLPAAPAVKPEHLGTLRSLQDVVEFLTGGTERPGFPGDHETGASRTPFQSPGSNEQTRAPVQRLLVCSTPAPVSSETVTPRLRPGGEVWVVDDTSGLAEAVVERLGAQGYRARLVDSGDLTTVVPSRLDGLLLLAPEAGDGDRVVKAAFRALRACGPALRRAGAEGSALVVSVTRLDGAFGTQALGADADPAMGGLAGLVKTAGHEWPEVACKAIDLDPALGTSADAAEAIVAELFRPGPIEVGLSATGRSTLELRPAPLPARESGSLHAAPIQPGEVVIVTGGARGVTAEVAVALAEAFQPTLVLLGRSPAPEGEPEWLASLDGEAEIKRVLASQANGQATPQRIGEQYRRVSANREILRNLDRIARAGANVVYRQVDVRDPAAIRAALLEIGASFGPVRGIVHGAGVLADRRIEDKTDAQFDAVYDTKVAGLRALLEASGPDELRMLALFSSSTARFGRTGQVAYAAANEVLNKIAQREARRRPDCRVVSVNWGPWDGGMVTPSLRAVFESEGIGLIPLGDGARYLVEELRSRDDRPVEVVVLGGTRVPDGLAIPVAQPQVAVADAPAAPQLATAFERPLDLATLPVLRSHVIDGHGVLPMALILEWLAHGALQRNPGLTLCSVDDLRLLKGAVLHDDRAETLAVLVGKAVREGSQYRVPVELRGIQSAGKTVTHARAEVVLGMTAPRAEQRVELPEQPPCELTLRAIYHDVLFHGPELQGIERVETLGPAGATALARTGAAPVSWVERPLRQSWLTDPLALDCAFQLLSLWSHEQAGAPSLPTRVGRYLQFARTFPTPRVRLVARVDRPSEHRAVADIDFLDGAGSPVARIEGYECVIDASLTQAFRRNRLVPAKAAQSPR